MKLFAYILDTTRSFRVLLISMIFCIFLIALDANLRPYIIKNIIDQSSNFNLKNFVILSGLYLLSQVTMVLANALFDWLGTKFHTSYRGYTAHKFFDRLTKYQYRFFQETQAGTITSVISDAFNVIPGLIFTIIRIFINFILFLLIAITLLSSVSYYFALASVIWIVIFLSLTIIFYKKYEPLNADFAKVRPRIYGFLSDYFSNILSVWFFANEKSEKKQFEQLTNQFKEKSTVCGIFLRNYYAINGIIVAIYMMVLFILLGYLAHSNQISSGDFALVFMVNYKIVDSLFEISNSSREFVTNCGVAQNAIKMLDHPIGMEDKKDTKNVVIKARPTIVFEDVSFSYHNGASIFHKLSVQVRSGEKVGLVGYSGGGKTSFINVILRLYEINSGKIFIDNHNISDLTLSDLHNAIAVIPQDPALFHRTIIENIRYGKPGATDEEVIIAAKRSNAHEFITSLAEGYNTLVGERGVKLSGGQRQRIAIARAILKDAPILILDEATSQLDSITENNIRDNLTELMHNKTAIVVAHRLSTLMQMDRILVFNDGKIVEDGTHKELIAKGGLFKSLWDSQAGGMLPSKMIPTL